jgi:hypothetical protein
MGSLAFTLGLVGFSALGVEYTPAWLHVQEFIERAEQALLSAIDPQPKSSYASKLEKTQPYFRKRLTSTRQKRFREKQWRHS